MAKTVVGAFRIAGTVTLEGVNDTQSKLNGMTNSVKKAGKEANKFATRSGRRTTQAMLELSRGAEDATIVFGTQGLAGSLRASANNISQFANILNPAAGAVTGFAVAIGTILIPKLAGLSNSLDKVLKKMKEVRNEENRRREFNKGKGEEQQIKANRRLEEEVKNLKQSEVIRKRIKTLQGNQQEAKSLTASKRDTVGRVLTGLLGGDRSRKNVTELTKFAIADKKSGTNILRALGIQGGKKSVPITKVGQISKGSRLAIVDEIKKRLASQLSGKTAFDQRGTLLQDLIRFAEASDNADFNAAAEQLKKLRDGIRRLGKESFNDNELARQLKKKLPAVLAKEFNEEFQKVVHKAVVDAAKTAERETAKANKKAADEEKKNAAQDARNSRQLRSDLKRLPALRSQATGRRLRFDIARERDRLRDFGVRGPNNAALKGQDSFKAVASAIRDQQKARDETKLRMLQEKLIDIERKQLQKLEALVNKLNVVSAFGPGGFF